MLVVNFGVALLTCRFGIPYLVLVPIHPELWLNNSIDNEPPSYVPMTDLADESILPQDMQYDAER